MAALGRIMCEGILMGGTMTRRGVMMGAAGFAGVALRGVTAGVAGFAVGFVADFSGAALLGVTVGVAGFAGCTVAFLPSGNKYFLLTQPPTPLE
jgi:hypothetical protein